MVLFPDQDHRLKWDFAMDIISNRAKLAWNGTNRVLSASLYGRLYKKDEMPDISSSVKVAVFYHIVACCVLLDFLRDGLC